MKVKELIGKLKTFDPDKEVMLLADEFYTYQPSISLKEIKVQKWIGEHWGEEWYDVEQGGRECCGEKKIGKQKEIIAL